MQHYSFVSIPAFAGQMLVTMTSLVEGGNVRIVHLFIIFIGSIAKNCFAHVYFNFDNWCGNICQKLCHCGCCGAYCGSIAKTIVSKCDCPGSWIFWYDSHGWLVQSIVCRYGNSTCVLVIWLESVGSSCDKEYWGMVETWIWSTWMLVYFVIYFGKIVLGDALGGAHGCHWYVIGTCKWQNIFRFIIVK